jgi:uncharacterized protein involved in outer membrane biogenesis
MARILRAAAIVLGVLVLLVAAAAVVLPRLVAGEDVRERITREVRQRTGREVVWQDLQLRVLPPRVQLVGSSLSGATADAPPFAEAQSIALRLSLLPLLVGAVVVDSLEIEGATLRLARTADGIQWPRPAKPPEEPEEPDQADTEPKPEAQRKPRRRKTDFGVKRVSLDGVRIVLEDRAVSPPVTWDLGPVSGSAEIAGPGGPIRVELDGTLDGSGRILGSGVAGLDRSVDVCLELSGVGLAPLRSYLRRGQALSGAVDGKIHLRGAAGETDRLALGLRLSDAVLDVEELRAEGNLALEATLTGPPFAGPFHLDAGAAQLETGGSVAFRKPSGMPATAVGRLVSRDGRYDVEHVKVEIGAPGPAGSGADPCAPAANP